MKEIKVEKSITNRNNDSLERYLRDIGTYQLLTAEDETILCRKIKTGDEAALRKLVNANLRFVVTVAKKYEGQGLSLADLVSEGNIGLVKAARRFDDTRGFKFISYAVWWIRQAIMHALGEYRRVVRLPMNQVNGILEMTKATVKLEQHLERNPTTEEIAEFLGISTDKVMDYEHNSGKSLSLDATLPDKEESWLLAVIEDTTYDKPDAGLEYMGLTQNVNLLFNKLSARQQDIIRMAYGLNGTVPMQNEDISLCLGLSAETVRKDRHRALRNMLDTTSIKVMKQYL